MRTSRSLTVSRKRGCWCIPEEILGKKKLKKKFELKKIWITHPPQNLETPKKLETPLPGTRPPPKKKIETPQKIREPPRPDPPQN